MKIERLLCVGSYKLPSNAWLRVLAFQRLGYAVQWVDTAFWGQRLRKLANWPARWLTRRALNHRIRRRITAFQPQAVFFEKNIWMSAKDLGSIRRRGPPGMLLVHYNPDDPFGEFARPWSDFIAAISSYDVHFVPKQENVADYHRHGARKVFAFDRAFDPLVHRPVQLTPDEKAKYACQVGFIGSWARHREEMIARLIRDGIPVAVWGNGWNRGPHWQTIRPHWRGPTQVGEDYTKAICGMQIALHFLRRENRDLQDSRTFEIPACGTFMLAERTPDHERLFKDGEEAVFFDDYSDLFAKIATFSQNKERRENIALAGSQKSLSAGYYHDCRLSSFMNLLS